MDNLASRTHACTHACKQASKHASTHTRTDCRAVKRTNAHVDARRGVDILEKDVHDVAAAADAWLNIDAALATEAAVAEGNVANPTRHLGADRETTPPTSLARDVLHLFEISARIFFQATASRYDWHRCMHARQIIRLTAARRRTNTFSVGMARFSPKPSRPLFTHTPETLTNKAASFDISKRPSCGHRPRCMRTRTIVTIVDENILDHSVSAAVKVDSVSTQCA